VRVRDRARRRALTPLRSLRGFDPAIYGRALVLLVRFPQVMAWPLLAGIFEYLILSAIPGSGNGGFDTLSASLYGLLGRLVSGFGFALALISADSVWRYGRAPLGDTWETGTKKIGDLFFAALGFTFVVSLAGIVGSFLGPVSILLVLVAYYFFVYTIPAAAIGGVPGGAALNTSLERARENPGPTLPVAVLYYAVVYILPPAVIDLLSPLLLTSAVFANPVVGSLAVVVVTTIFRGYLALVMSKTYTDLAFGRRRW
jgi:hypothetical protein